MDLGWEILVAIQELQVTHRLHVHGETHIGAIMQKLVELTKVKKDWSDHGLWWPLEKKWLIKNRVTLDQVGVFANTELEFIPKHGTVWVQLPDLQERPMKLSFSQSVFSVLVGLCRDLGIRHPEELSLRKRQVPSDRSPSSANGTFRRFGSLRRSKSAKSSSQAEVRSPSSVNGFSSGYNTLLVRQTSQGSPLKSPLSEEMTNASPISLNFEMFEGAEQSQLANSPHVPAQTAIAEKGLLRVKSFTERAMSSEGWLDSSTSLMQQGVRPGIGYDEQTSLQLRYKFLSFYDLNGKYDAIRINQIYEQLKWSVLSEELDCTEEEALLLAAIQLQVRLSSATASSPALLGTLPSGSSTLGKRPAQDQTDAAEDKINDDDIDAALAELEASLMSDAFMTLGSPKRSPDKRNPQSPQSPGLTKIPELLGFLKLFKPRKHSTIRGYRRLYFELRETQLSIYTDQTKSRVVENLNLLGSQITPRVNAASRKFGIQLFISEPESPSSQLQELWLRCDTKQQYADWVAGLRLAARGKSLASKGEFEAEVSATITQLELQAPKPQPRLLLENAPPIDPDDFLPVRVTKLRKPRQLVQQILDRHTNVRERSSMEAKLEYINICQRLPMFGIAYFIVNCFSDVSQVEFHEFRKSRGGSIAKEELIAVAPNRVMRLELPSGKIVNTWRLEDLESWTVNWEVNCVELRLRGAQKGLVLLPSASSPALAKSVRECLCKSLAEFIGGYVFLSLRKPEKSQELNEQLFQQLTACRDVSKSCCA